MSSSIPWFPLRLPLRLRNNLGALVLKESALHGHVYSGRQDGVSWRIEVLPDQICWVAETDDGQRVAGDVRNGSNHYFLAFLPDLDIGDGIRATIVYDDEAHKQVVSRCDAPNA